MANFRMVQTSFWTDPKIMDDFTPEDRLFYFYLLTNPYTNLCGCYEISVKQMANEMGFSVDTVKSLIARFEEYYDMIRYSDNKEMLILNWHKYNWTASEKMRKAIEKEILEIKTDGFREYLKQIFNGVDEAEALDTLSIGYAYPIKKNRNLALSISNTITNSNSNTNTNTSTSNEVLENIQNTDTKQNKSKDTKKKTRSSLKEMIDTYTDSQELREALYEYVKMRKAMKKGFTEHMLKLNLKALDKLADNDRLKCEIVNQTVANQWLGFWELKNGPKGPEVPDWYADEGCSPPDDELLKQALMLQKEGGKDEQSDSYRTIDKGSRAETNGIRNTGQLLQPGC